MRPLRMGPAEPLPGWTDARKRQCLPRVNKRDKPTKRTARSSDCSLVTAPIARIPLATTSPASHFVVANFSAGGVRATQKSIATVGEHILTVPKEIFCRDSSPKAMATVRLIIMPFRYRLVEGTSATSSEGSLFA